MNIRKGLNGEFAAGSEDSTPGRTAHPKVESLYPPAVLQKNIHGFHELPILMYHRVVARVPAFSKFRQHVTMENLEQQLQWLDQWGFTPVVFQDLLEKKLPRKPIILTFDDGYEDNYLCLLPLLQKYRVPAVIYILGDRTLFQNEWDIPQGEPVIPLLTPSHIKEMAESGWVEFGAHSMTHAKLTTLPSDEITRQAGDCKTALEKFLGKRVVSFAYPYGETNEEIKKITQKAGYTFGVSVKSGPTRFQDDLMEIGRVPMFPQTSRWQYFKKTSGFYLRYRRWIGK